jgi:hypothetical protein
VYIIVIESHSVISYTYIFIDCQSWIVSANRVTYIKGWTTNSHHLSKAKVESASACFIMAADYTERGADFVDAITVMRALSIKRYHSDSKLFVQVVQPQNKQHFDSMGMLRLFMCSICPAND